MKYNFATLLLTIDLIGTFVFALEGAMAAIENKLDLLGLLVLSFATALGGGANQLPHPVAGHSHAPRHDPAANHPLEPVADRRCLWLSRQLALLSAL